MFVMWAWGSGGGERAGGGVIGRSGEDSRGNKRGYKREITQFNAI